MEHKLSGKKILEGIDFTKIDAIEKAKSIQVGDVKASKKLTVKY